MGLASRALVVSLSRFANYGLMLVSPIVLVRLLPVEDFGRYREFVLYASLLQAMAGFGVASSLLYFVPSYRGSLWRIVRQTALLTFLCSIAVMGLFVVADAAFSNALAGTHLIALTIYVLLFVNLDFWEFLWLANKNSLGVLVYSVGRLAARLTVVLVIAALTESVEAMIVGLCVLEAVRFAGSAIAWRIIDRAHAEPPVRGVWQEQLRFCLPSGLAAVVYIVSRNLGNIAVAKMLGVTALAHYSIGLYGEPILIALRNSVSSVLLPEMVSKGGQSDQALVLWRRAVIVNCILLFPIAVVLLRYAEPLVVGVFGEAFRAAAPVLQIYVLVIVRECCDFSPPLRSINKTWPLMYSNVAGLLVNTALVLALLPQAGLVGAAVALVASNYVDALCLGWYVSRLYGLSFASLLPWGAIAKVAVCAAVAALTIVSPLWTDALGFAGIVVGSMVFGGCFLVMLRLLHVDEALLLMTRTRDAAMNAWRKMRV